MIRTATVTVLALCVAVLAGCAQPSPADPAPAPQPAAVEGDTAAPTLDRRQFTERTVRLTWDSATPAGRDQLCAHPAAFTSPALDTTYATKLIKEKCHAR